VTKLTSQVGPPRMIMIDGLVTLSTLMPTAYHCGTAFAGVAAPVSTFIDTGSTSAPVWSMTAAPIAARAVRDAR
jgi:hypothetical protein